MLPQSVFVLHACAHNPTGGIDPTRNNGIILPEAMQNMIAFDCA